LVEAYIISSLSLSLRRTDINVGPMNKKAIIIAAIIIFGAGLYFLSQNTSKEINKTPVVFNEAPIEFMVGIYDDGSPFIDWKGEYIFNTQCIGRIQDKTSARVKAVLKSAERNVDISLELKYDENERYVVKGNVIVDKKAKLVLLGTGESEDKDRNININEGANEINYQGKLIDTFRRKK